MPPLLYALRLVVAGAVQQLQPEWLKRPGYAETTERNARGLVERHLDATISWLKRSCSVSNHGGSSKGYHLLRGWLPSYPETTGYAIPTLYDYAVWAGRDDLRDLAAALAKWLIRVQLPDGGCRGGDMAQPPVPVIFNTGQIMFGLLRCFAETGAQDCLSAASRAGDFLVEHIDDDGAWRRYAYCGIPHVYSARCAWALLLLARATGKSRYSEVARANLNWGVAQQQDNGWYQNNNFRPGQLPNTHGIAYVTQSMVEAYCLTDDERYLESAIRAADPLLRKLELTGFIYGTHDANWRSPVRYSCVTGNIQLGITWLRLYQLRSDVRYLNAALKIVDWVRTIQSTTHSNAGVRGAIPGSNPIFGQYAPMQYPNWAAKFWADCLMLTEALVRPLASQHENAREPDTTQAGRALVLSDRYSG
jgi:rhamnogalacturonyl hydrolase YesR